MGKNKPFIMSEILYIYNNIFNRVTFLLIICFVYNGKNKLLKISMIHNLYFTRNDNYIT